MTNADKKEKLNKLKTKLNATCKNCKHYIDRQKIRKQIKELERTMTDEGFEKMLKERSEIDVGKCR